MWLFALACQRVRASSFYFKQKQTIKENKPHTHEVVSQLKTHHFLTFNYILMEILFADQH